MFTPARPPHVLSVFATFAVGGPQMRFAALANHFGPALRHSIIAMDGRLQARDLLDPALVTAFPRPLRAGDGTLGNVGRMVGFLRQSKPDVLMTSNWGSIEWAMARGMTGTRHIHMEDGFGPEERAAQLRRRVLARRMLLRGSDTIVPSRVLEDIARTVWRLPRRRLHYIPNGIDLARFRRAVPAGLPAGEGKVVGTIAALRAEKNLARLIRAFALVRARLPARLVIVGDGPERMMLERLAVECGVAENCHFAGHSDAPESWLAVFDVFALSSDTEQMPLSVLEAAAAGLPVAATDVGDVRRMLAPENAPYLAALNADSLAEALHALLTDAGACGIGARNRARADAAFGQEKMFRAYAEHIGVDAGIRS